MKIILGTLAIIVIAIGGCTIFLPERFAVNAPIMNSLFGWGAELEPADVLQTRLMLPDGYDFNVYAEGLGHARIMRWTKGGDLLLSTPRTGEIKIIRAGASGSERGGAVEVLIDGLNRPHGVEIVGDYLYIGETDAILHIPFDNARGILTGEAEYIVTDLPGGGNHWTRTVKQGPDGWLYVNIGSSCNVCLEDDERRSTLMRFRPDGSDIEIFAEGLRNTVGWDWQPGTGNLYGVDNGRDLLGDNEPPEEVNLIRRGGFYGWPFLNGFNKPDPDFGDISDPRIKDAIEPAYGMTAHIAPLAITFMGNDAPPGLEGAALVTQHGSWNRTRKAGYKVISLHWRTDGSIEDRDFFTGFEKDEDVIGRPVDVTIGPDGAIYVSDDYAGAIYRITHESMESAHGTASPTKTTRHTTPASAKPERPIALTADLIRTGAKLWQDNMCAVCHSLSEASTDIAYVRLDNLSTRYNIDDIVSILKVPPGNMPAPPISDAEREALAYYVLDRF
ncbi:MAG: PQQ-dependent sugar dehydrogenase [Parvularculales bacterium]